MAAMLFDSCDRPKISSSSRNEEDKLPEFTGWRSCSGCREMVHESELASHFDCCKLCGYHFRISGRKRLAMLTDPGSFVELFAEVRPCDQLGFVDLVPYKERLNKAVSSSQLSEAVRVGFGKIEGSEVALGVFEFQFMGGSMGSVVGERLTALAEYALEKRLPLIIVSSSGGARMQESVFSLMQMAKISAALARLSDAHLPFISVLTDPTSGGVTASFASLGDIIVAEPGALICFTGPRVIEQTMRTTLPEGFQTSEFLLSHGFIDMVTSRCKLKATLSSLLGYLT